MGEILLRSERADQNPKKIATNFYQSIFSLIAFEGYPTDERDGTKWDLEDLVEQFKSGS